MLKQRKVKESKEEHVVIVPKYYEDLKIVHENTMPYRAYYIPASHYMGSSDRRQVFFRTVSWR